MIWLTTPWHFLVDAPRFIWLAAAGIFAGTMEELVRMFLGVRREQVICRNLASAVRNLGREFPSRRWGLPEAGYESLRKAFEATPKLSSATHNYLSELVGQAGPDGHDYYFAEESAAKAFSEAAVFGGRVNWRWFSAFPGFITGLGLLFTFLAILIALGDLKADATGQITGIQQLLEGLSGKFLSSVVALFLASFFLICERTALHRLDGIRHDLIDTIDEFAPRLTPARLLVEIRRDSAEQADALRTMLQISDANSAKA
jgi:hypothetical protein